ncbi:MAG: sn-glycerol-3-phosphate ABC transporter ATP-binding protein UgpC [Planctomycetes bacterium]|nr:sn-glycerol-3-phosphate ABC transporter ATP-binding protein UgpC [Planctomycetota bacterium]
MAQVVLEHVAKTYPGNIRAVDDVSLEVADGELIVLVGPSGCGKTTTLRMIAGLEELTGGVIRIGDRVVNDLAPKDRDIAMVFQNYALYPHMNVRKNLSFGLRLRRVPKAEIKTKVEATAAMLGISDLLDRKPRALSGGQQQRVALGRAMVRDPACFLLDEPLSNLDARLRVEMRGEIKRLQRQLGTTMIYVTHDQEEAMTLGDRIVVMHEGMIQQCGDPLSVYHHPANRFVAGFIGSPPMNFLDGKIIADADGLWLEHSPWRIRLPEWAANRFAGNVPERVILGIRPSAISSRSEGRFADDGNALSAQVLAVEPLGEAMDVHLTGATGGSPSSAEATQLIARMDFDPTVEADTQRDFYLDPARLHLFAADANGKNLCVASERTGTT